MSRARDTGRARVHCPRAEVEKRPMAVPTRRRADFAAFGQMTEAGRQRAGRAVKPCPFVPVCCRVDFAAFGRMGALGRRRVSGRGQRCRSCWRQAALVSLDSDEKPNRGGGLFRARERGWRRGLDCWCRRSGSGLLSNSGKGAAAGGPAALLSRSRGYRTKRRGARAARSVGGLVKEGRRRRHLENIAQTRADLALFS